jgi:hypothetical protein
MILSIKNLFIYRYNIYRLKDWWYKNIKQIYYFWKFCRKADEDIFYLWDGQSMENYICEWLKQHIEKYNRYFPIEEKAEYQVSDFRKNPERYNTSLDKIELMKKDIMNDYSKIENCYKYVSKFKKENDKLFWEHNGLYSGSHDFIKIEDEKDSNFGLFKWSKIKNLIYHYFDYTISEIGELSIIVNKECIISEQEWWDKKNKMEENLKTTKNKILKQIIDIREMIWD